MLRALYNNPIQYGRTVNELTEFCRMKICATFKLDENRTYRNNYFIYICTKKLNQLAYAKY